MKIAFPKIGKSKSSARQLPPVLCIFFTVVLSACEGGQIDPNDPLENNGAFTVTSQDLVVDNPEDASQAINVRVYTPVDVGSDTPLVILLPGFGASFTDYITYIEHLVSHGITVAGLTPRSTGRNPLDGEHDYLARQVIYSIDEILVTQTIASNIDTQRIATMGHSQGAKIAFYAAALDSRINVVIAMDPVNSGGAPCIISSVWCDAYAVAPNPGRSQQGLLNDVEAASLILRSQPDIGNPESEFNAEFFFFGSDGLGENAVAAPALYIDMGNTPHAAYAPSSISGLTVPFAKRTSLAWLRKHYYGDDVESYLVGNIIEESIASGIARSFTPRE